MARDKKVEVKTTPQIAPGSFFTIQGVGYAYGKKGQIIRGGRNVATGRKMKAATALILDVFKAE